MWSLVGINKVAYLFCIYCKVKTRIQGEECHNPRSRCACVWKVCGLECSFNIIFLSTLFYLETWLEFFNNGPSCVHIFFSGPSCVHNFFFLVDLHVSTFFFLLLSLNVSFLLTRVRETEIL